jgi:hypothetical protein
MLKSLDILIGLVVILLVLSMAVTVITQCITAIANSRGRHLRRGLVDLLQQLDPALTKTLSHDVATAILSHPLVSGSNTPIAAGSDDSRSLAGRVRRALGGARLGNVIHREEFIKLLMAFGGGQSTTQLGSSAQMALMRALEANGIQNPGSALKDIRLAALQLEKNAPDLPHMARQNLAILRAAESDLVAKINNWFDQTMDRTSQRFTASTRAVTFAGAFIVAFGLQVDTPAMVNRLAADNQLREAFVSQAASVYATGSANSPEPIDLGPEDVARRYQAFLATNGLIRVPSSGLREWWIGFRHINVFGVLLTALLLSFGAPFWYSTLGGLLRLRSVLATKDDAQRTGRQQNDGSRAPANPTFGEPLSVTTSQTER